MRVVEMVDPTPPHPHAGSERARKSAREHAPTRAGSIYGDTPELSIVLPVHNGEAFLAQAIESILAQSFTDFELIAVDDCSDDSSPAILARYAARDLRMHIVTLDSNVRLPGALNAGFAQARGQWLSWTSDDNILHPAMLTTLLGKRNRQSGADILYAGYRVIDAQGRGIGEVRAEPDDHLLERNVVGCCFVYRRAVHEELGGYDESLFGVEDYDFWLRAARAGFRLQPVDAQLYDYRRHESSLTDRRWHDIRAGVEHVVEREIEHTADSGRRARGWLTLFTGNPYRPTPRFLLKALRARPSVVIARWRDLLGWTWRTLAWRLK
ncbi:MAG: glycosyltransferase [Erythrobacter sp.]|nr:glycosyltransferase [Erythrobacter sp.]NCQ64695.1 glycosyltransferase [Alphaproteobacteria bacterium]